MAKISDQQINDIRNKADIAHVISQYLPLVRRGRSILAICPFHEDHNPSLSISSEKQIYKCFVCGAGGNVFTFVSNYEKISFIKAVSKVAESVGIILDTQEETIPIDPAKQALYTLLKETVNFAKYQLHSADGVLIKDYLIQRGLHEKLLEAFDVGYIPSGNSCSTFLLAKGYKASDAIGANIIRLGNQDYMDVFANRIVFPIADEIGRTIGFTARSVLQDETAKYINTSETDLFIKGDVLYNVHRASSEAKKSGFVVVVEGVTDVMAYYRCNILNVVATLGTATTVNQIKKIKKTHWNVVLAYDGDEAGRAATFKTGKMLIEANCSVEIVRYPNQLDPDDLLNTYGEDALHNALKQRIAWLEFVLEYGQSLYDLSNYNQKKQYVLNMSREIAKSNDVLDKRFFTERLAKVTDYHFEDIWALVDQSKPVRPTKIQTRIIKDKDDVSTSEKEILAQMMISKEAAIRFRDELGFLISPIAHRYANLILDQYRQTDHLLLADLLSKSQEETLQRFILSLADWPLFPKSASDDVLVDAFNNVRISVIENKVKKLRQMAQQIIDPIEKAEIADQMLRLKQDIRELKK